jgi:RNA polymerase sigma-70 factor (ECF subfamily)
MNKTAVETQILSWVKSPKTKHKGISKIIEIYQESLYWHIRKMVLSHDDAKDILQEVFLRTWYKIDTFKGDSKLFTWLYRIATNETLRFLDRKNRILSNNNQLQETLKNNLETLDLVSGDEIQIQLQKAILQLPRKQRLVFNMRYFDELKYEDISEIIETSVNSCKVSYHHAKTKIEQILKEEIIV